MKYWGTRILPVPAGRLFIFFLLFIPVLVFFDSRF